ncbi:MAG: acyl--CoA ligase [Actinobacteria bacterium]|nr:acyl--CoA ligase [Actinomycetota bacterium]
MAAGDCQLTYADLKYQVDRAAWWLHSLGVRRGGVIAILAPPSIDFLCLHLAAASLSIATLGLNPKYTRRELDFVIGDARPDLIFSCRTFRGKDVSPRLEGRDVIWLPAEPAPRSEPAGALAEDEQCLLDAVRASVAPQDTALIVYTSGSTGQPKGAQISHAALVHAARARCIAWPVTPFRILSNLPINHIGGAGDIPCMALVAGGSQHIMESFDATETLAFMTEQNVTVWYQVPTMFQLVLDGIPGAKPAHVTASIWSGGQASAELGRRLADMSEFVATDYSMTESVGPISLSGLLRDVDFVTQTSGFPPSDREVRIVDLETEASCSPGRDGEIRIRDAFLMSGYLNRPDATKSAMDADGWFRTGDIGHFREDGALVITGRMSGMFKSGGYNVYPQEIEQVLEAHPQIASAAVVSIADPVYTQVGWAYVVPRQSADISLDDLKAWCRDRLANYKIPKRFHISSQLPMLPVGKIDRARLAEQVQSKLGMDAP